MSFTKKIVTTDKAPAAIGTYSQGVIHNGVYYFSGQIGLNPQTMVMGSTFITQLNQVMENIDGLLSSCGLKRENVIKTTIFLTSLENFNEVNIAYEKFFSKPFPARSTVEVSKLPRNAMVEIEVLAAQ
jgi:2-iminobutanoate/2-iminopropanoate deaminase